MPGSWYVFVGNEVKGPFPTEEVRKLPLSSETQVCPAGEQNWYSAADFPELIPPASSSGEEGETEAPRAAEAPPPEPVREAPPAGRRKKIFIIHGKGIKLEEAFRKVIGVLRTKIYYQSGEYLMKAEDSNLIRYLLYEWHENLVLSALDKMITGKLVLAPYYPPSEKIHLGEGWMKLSSFKATDKLNYYGAPERGHSKQREWWEGAFKSIWSDLGRLFGVSASSQPGLQKVLTEVLDGIEGGRALTEREFEEAARAAIAGRGGDSGMVMEALLDIRKIHEAGGDLDTVGSNALYGAWVIEASRVETGEPAVYGRDFDFDFVNYNESFLHLAGHENCDIYIPDFPMDTIPNLEETAKAAISNGARIVRIDDHHPVTKETYAFLDHLKNTDLIDEWVMSGPIKGGPEQPPEERTCGADLVHKAMLEGTPLDTDGLRELRRLAHVQDLHIMEDVLAIDLSKLIGSRWSKYDMVQNLMLVRTMEDITGIMERTGWREKVDEYEKGLAEVTPKLEENLFRMDFIMPDEVDEAEANLFGPVAWFAKLVKIVSLGSVDLESIMTARRSPELVHRIYIALAPFQSRKEARINVASAINYLKDRYDMDYFFYTWGGNLLTTRKVNEEDEALNLSTLMPMIGGPTDGGHPSAATCKPPANPYWPKDRFPRVTKMNFEDFIRYVSYKITKGTGARFVSIRRVASGKKDESSAGDAASNPFSPSV